MSLDDNWNFLLNYDWNFDRVWLRYGYFDWVGFRYMDCVWHRYRNLYWNFHRVGNFLFNRIRNFLLHIYGIGFWHGDWIRFLYGNSDRDFHRNWDFLLNMHGIRLWNWHFHLLGDCDGFHVPFTTSG